MPRKQTLADLMPGGGVEFTSPEALAAIAPARDVLSPSYMVAYGHSAFPTESGRALPTPTDEEMLNAIWSLIGVPRALGTVIGHGAASGYARGIGNPPKYEGSRLPVDRRMELERMAQEILSRRG